MLIHLKIQNLILVDLADISFGFGLNILTGETGAGKSAILSAIRFISGDRADTQLIGKNGDLAIIEASISSYSLPEEIPQPSPGEPLSIRRELHKSGKSRCFIEDSLVSLSTLRQVVGTSIELVDQSSSAELCCIEEQRNMLDCFGDSLENAKAFACSFSEEKKLLKRLNDLKIAQETRNRDLIWAKEDLAIIEEINWQIDEEERLIQDHRILTHSQELFEKIESVIHLLDENFIKKAASTIEMCSHLDKSLHTPAAALKNAALETEEVRLTLLSYLNRLEINPTHLHAIEERMAKIEQIKRRFGKTFEEISKKKDELLSRINTLDHLDQEFSLLETHLSQKKEENLLLSKTLTRKRKDSAEIFAKTILKELKTLNLPHAQFLISVTEESMSTHGSDAIRFLFSANPGHPPIPLENCASGGELSRLLLAIKSVLAEKEKSTCLIFDEIDSNVGGQTASILGEKLRSLATQKQVICVTHFIQVARCAMHHFAVSKTEVSGRTSTSITSLKDADREKEYQRMLGT